MAFSPTDDLPHAGAAVEEWLFAAWTPDAHLGVVSGHRLVAGGDWYWAALVEAGRPLLHLTEWNVARRTDPLIVKAPEMWAEHHCVAAMEQWSVGNEAHAAALDEPDEALGRGYGVPTPMAMDLEWYATGDVEPIEATAEHGYRQVGVLHGLIELLGRPNLELAEVPAVRWHRWSDRPGMGPVPLEAVVAHTGLRAPFAFPDGTVSDWVLSPAGWRVRHRPG
jgi:hypothetical protein